jgi:hypothetical protein
MTTERSRASILVAAFLSMLGIVGACAMPSDSEPKTIAVGDEHTELLDPAPPVSEPSTTVLEATREVGLWFIVDDVLARESRQINVSRATSLTAVLNELAGGTRQENHRSAIPSGVEILDVRIDEATRTATVELIDDTLLTNVEGLELTRAIAQLVFTVSDRGRWGVSFVRFEIDGNIRSVPTGGGSNTNEPVGPCDYTRLDPDPLIRGCPVPTTTTIATPPLLPPIDPAAVPNG